MSKKVVSHHHRYLQNIKYSLSQTCLQVDTIHTHIHNKLYMYDNVVMYLVPSPVKWRRPKPAKF